VSSDVDLIREHATSSTEIVTLYEQRFEIHDGLLARASMTLGALGQPTAAELAGGKGDDG
jgi:hypothetical protein